MGALSSTQAATQGAITTPTAAVADLNALDFALDEAVSQGWPYWISEGAGANAPSQRIHDFSRHNLQEGARIDFARGADEDDFLNRHDI